MPPLVQDLSLEKPALNDLFPSVGRPASAHHSKLSSIGESPSLPGGVPGGQSIMNAGQARVNAVRELQEENARLREKLADVQVATRSEGPSVDNLAKVMQSLLTLISQCAGVEVWNSCGYGAYFIELMDDAFVVTCNA